MTPASKPRVGRSLLILSDIQFWIPVGVLAGGLLVLGWMLVPFQTGSISDRACAVARSIDSVVSVVVKGTELL